MEFTRGENIPEKEKMTRWGAKRCAKIKEKCNLL